MSASTATRLVIGDRVMPLSWRQREELGRRRAPISGRSINFRGPALLDDLKSRTYPTYSFFDLLLPSRQILNDASRRSIRRVFRDKIVFVGATAPASSTSSRRRSANGKMPGIQIHAAVADDILSNRFIREPARRVRVATVVGGRAASSASSRRSLPAWWATAATAVFIAVLGWVGHARCSPAATG